MGTAYDFRCKKCGYTISGRFGIGFRFPMVYEQTITAARNGELGKEIQQFLNEHPDGAIDVSNTLAICSQCGEYK